MKIGYVTNQMVERVSQSMRHLQHKHLLQRDVHTSTEAL